MDWFKQHLNWTLVIASGVALLLLGLIVYMIELANSEVFALFISLFNIAIILGWLIVCGWILNRKRKK
jgi:hypothetical protein